MLGNEVLQFQMATLLSPGVYRLSNLLRGRLGTEAFIASHAIGERFVLLNESVVPLVVPTANAGQEWSLRATTFGELLVSGTLYTHIVAANSLRPFSPVHIRAKRDLAGDVTIQWVRRTRLDGGAF